MTDSDNQEYREWLDSLDEERRQKFEEMDRERNAITGLRYIAPTFSATEWSIGFFEGRQMSEDMTHEVQLSKPLSNNWVAINFAPDFVTLLKRTPGVWFPVSAGSPTAENIADWLTVPSIICQFQQGDEPDCLFKSFASALFFLGMVETAHAISAGCAEARYQPLDVQLKALTSMMEVHGRPIGRPIRMGKRSTRGKVHKAPSIVEEKSIYPTVFIPKGSDGSIAHAIAVVDDVIFDSSQKYALKLCNASLNWVCGGGYNGVHICLRFHRAHKTNEAFERTMTTNW